MFSESSVDVRKVAYLNKSMRAQLHQLLVDILTLSVPTIHTAILCISGGGSTAARAPITHVNSHNGDSNAERHMFCNWFSCLEESQQRSSTKTMRPK
jgi:hypothetical protein